MSVAKLPEGRERFTPPEPNAQGPSTQTVRRTGSTSPFWWVIRCRCHYWVPPFREWHYSVRAPGVRTGDPKQSGATVYPRRRDAVRVLRRLRADEPKAEFRLVKVWARWVMPEERDRSRALHESRASYALPNLSEDHARAAIVLRDAWSSLSPAEIEQVRRIAGGAR